MLLTFCKSKINPATVTATELEYECSITIDADIAEAAGISVGEQVHVLNLSNGSRLITYAIIGERGSEVICLNGPSAHAGRVGDRVTILAYAHLTEEEAKALKMRLVRLDARNRIVK